MDSIKAILGQRIKNYSFSPTVNSAMIVEKFNELLAGEFSEEMVKKQARAVYIKNKAIYIVALSPVIAQEIKFSEITLLAKINDYYNREIISKIYYL